jgi:hypothetical protein
MTNPNKKWFKPEGGDALARYSSEFPWHNHTPAASRRFKKGILVALLMSRKPGIGDAGRICRNVKGDVSVVTCVPNASPKKRRYPAFATVDVCHGDCYICNGCAVPAQVLIFSGK